MSFKRQECGSTFLALFVHSFLYMLIIKYNEGGRKPRDSQ